MKDLRDDHKIDLLFKKNLEHLDLGSQSHLWAGIKAELDKDKKSSRIFAFGWFSKLVLFFTLLSFGFILAYKFNLNEKTKVENQNNRTKIKESASIGSGQEMLNGSVASSGKSSSSEQIINESISISLTNNTFSKTIKNNKNSLQVIDNKTVISTRIKKIYTDSHVSSANSNILKNNLEESGINNKVSNTKDEKYTNSNSDQSFQTSETNLSSVVFHPTNTKEAEDLEPQINWLSPKPLSTLKYSVVSQKRKKREINDNCYWRNISPLSHFDFDIYFSPEISMRTMTAKSSSSIPYLQKRAGSESYVGANSLGIRVSYVSKSKFAIRTGVNFSKIKERFEFFNGVDSVYTYHSDANHKPIDTTLVIVNKIMTKYNSYKFVDIPVTLAYEIDLSDFVFSLNGGVAFNISSNYAGSVYDTDLMKTKELKAVKGESASEAYFNTKLGISLVGSFGLNYKFNRRLMLLAEPTIRYYLKSVTSDINPLDQKYFQLGISAGLRYRVF